jgi:hypothetical protein
MDQDERTLQAAITQQCSAFETEFRTQGYASPITKFKYACSLSLSKQHANLRLAVQLFQGREGDLILECVIM